ncbi:hypothetical protein OEA41_005454 [Lepraria neglecta]|uniref:Secreted protein n=1 Tax=Lepraria neglecta TaxID=209136 RepID=A0AAD9YZW8_9LECA|nr:hypothetical protein OEA41_005454 [Lepraria neglecta]
MTNPPLISACQVLTTILFYPFAEAQAFTADLKDSETMFYQNKSTTALLAGLLVRQVTSTFNVTLDFTDTTGADVSHLVTLNTGSSQAPPTRHRKRIPASARIMNQCIGLPQHLVFYESACNRPDNPQEVLVTCDISKPPGRGPPLGPI